MGTALKMQNAVYYFILKLAKKTLNSKKYSTATNINIF